MPLIGAIEKQHNRWNRKKIEQEGGGGGGGEKAIAKVWDINNFLERLS